MRRWVSAEQAGFERIGVEVGRLRGFVGDDEPDFDRLDDELNRLLSSIDAVANSMGVLLDLQLNERAYVVSLVATIFVPLTYVTGFFGMNFGWMIDHIDTPVAFWLLGFIIPIAAGALSWRFLARRFVMGSRPDCETPLRARRPRAAEGVGLEPRGTEVAQDRRRGDPNVPVTAKSRHHGGLRESLGKSPRSSSRVARPECSDSVVRREPGVQARRGSERAKRSGLVTTGCPRPRQAASPSRRPGRPRLLPSRPWST